MSKCCWLVLLFTLSAVPVFAHGPQLQIDIQSGKLVTRDILVDVYTPLTSPKSLYVLPIVGVPVTTPVAGTEWRPSPSPGFAFELAPDLAGSKINIGFTGGLQTWNGSSFVDAGAAQMQAYKAETTVPADPRNTISVDGGLSGLARVTTAAIPVPVDAHSGLTYKLLGNGIDSTSSLSDGIYLIGLQLSTDALIGQTPVSSSDPFYFLMNKNVDQTTFGAAYYSFASSSGFAPSQIQAFTAIPEPTTWALLISGTCAAFFVRRQRRSE